MYIIINENDISKKNIFFGNKMKNNIIENSDFYNIIYSDNTCSLNNIIMLFQIYHYKLEYSFHRYKLYFDTERNKHTLNKIKEIEKMFLSCFETQNIPTYSLYQNIKDGNLNVRCFDNNSIINLKNNNSIFIKIKISGIWKNSTNYGLIYKVFV